MTTSNQTLQVCSSVFVFSFDNENCYWVQLHCFISLYSPRSFKELHRQERETKEYSVTSSTDIMAEPETKSEPESETEPEMNLPPFPNAEPQIDLMSVSDAWLVAFKCHWIFFSVCFALLVLYNGYHLCKTYHSKRMANRCYITIVQTLVIFLGLTRSLALCISPYELTSNTPKQVPYVIPRLLFSAGYPCLFSGFTFVHKIFLNVSKVQVISRNALGNGLVAVVLVIHIIAVLASEIITSYVEGAKFFLLICALYYLTGCLAIALSLLFSGRRVVRKTRMIQSSLTEYKHTKTDGENFGKSKDNKSEAVLKVIRITAFAAIFGLLCALLYIYTLVWTIRGVIGDNSSPEAWSWLIVNTFLRLFELFLAATMSYAVGSTYQRSSRTRIFVSRGEDTVNTLSRS